MLWIKARSFLSVLKGSKINFVLEGIYFKDLIIFLFLVFFPFSISSKKNIHTKNKRFYVNGARTAIYVACQILIRRHKKQNVSKTCPIPEVILPAYSCIVVRNSIVAAGAKPIFLDITKTSFQYKFCDLAAAVNENTLAIVTQSIFGHSDQGIREKLKKKFPNIPIIQDHAHLPPVENNESIDFRVNSFEQSKPITCWTGGCLTVADKYSLETQELLNKFPLESFSDSIKCAFLLMLYYLAYRSKVRFAFLPILTILIRVFSIANSINTNEVQGSFDPADIKRLSSAKQKFVEIQQLNFQSRFNLHFRNYHVLAACVASSQFEVPTEFPLRLPILVDDVDKFSEHCNGYGISVGRWFSSPIHPASNWEKLIPLSPSQIRTATHFSQHMVNIPLSYQSSTKISVLKKALLEYEAYL